ncbi:MAG: hypothetical protein AB1651_19250 [Pseudomonadota bacterium]
MTRRGRPLGPVAQEVLRYAHDAGRVDSLSAARELQLSRSHAARAVYQLRSAGYLVEAERVAMPGARKPVVVCEPVREPQVPLIVTLDWPR